MIVAKNSSLRLGFFGPSPASQEACPENPGLRLDFGQNQFRIGLVHMERAIKERIRSTRTSTLEEDEIARQKYIKDEVRILAEERNKKILDLLVAGGLGQRLESTTGNVCAASTCA